MRHLAFLVVLALALGPAAAPAQEAEEGPWSLQAGLGFMAGPDAFLLGFEADYRLGKGFSVGPELQIGIDDDFTLVAPTIRARYSLDLSQMTSNEALHHLRPFLQSGVGFTYIDLDVPNVPFDVDDDDIGFLINFGLGAEYALSPSWAVSSKMQFNVLPDEVFGDSFYYTWEMASLRYRF